MFVDYKILKYLTRVFTFPSVKKLTNEGIVFVKKIPKRVSHH